MYENHMYPFVEYSLCEINFLGSTYKAEITFNWLKMSRGDVDETKKSLEEFLEKVEESEKIFRIIKIYLDSFGIHVTDKTELTEYIDCRRGFEIKPTEANPFHEVICKFALKQDEDYWLETHIVEGQIIESKARYEYEDF